MIDLFEQEIQLEADTKLAEVFAKFLELKESEAKISSEELLNIYVSLKLERHRIKRKINSIGNYYISTNDDELLMLLEKRLGEEK